MHNKEVALKKNLALLEEEEDDDDDEKSSGKILAKIVDSCKVAALKSAVFNLTTNILPSV